MPENCDIVIVTHQAFNLSTAWMCVHCTYVVYMFECQLYFVHLAFCIRTTASHLRFNYVNHNNFSRDGITYGEAALWKCPSLHLKIAYTYIRIAIDIGYYVCMKKIYCYRWKWWRLYIYCIVHIVHIDTTTCLSHGHRYVHVHVHIVYSTLKCTALHQFHIYHFFFHFQPISNFSLVQFFLQWNALLCHIVGCHDDVLRMPILRCTRKRTYERRW